MNAVTKLTKEHLDRLYLEVFRKEDFLAVDPCGIVYELKEHTDNQLDMEIGALLVAMISWGNRKAIRSAARYMLCEEMNWNPAGFVMDGRFENSYANAKNGCVYRTLNSTVFKEICRNLRSALYPYPTMEAALDGQTTEQCIATIAGWLSPARLGTPGKSACKRICMFLRWMIRSGEPDFGLWKSKSQAGLYAVMDVHVCSLTAPILTTRQANWKACTELTGIFRSWDASDPLHYDIALMTMADMDE